MALIALAAAGPYWIGDTPAPIRFTFEDEEQDPIELDAVNAVSAVVRVLGIPGTFPLAAAIDGDEVVVSFPEPVLGKAGIYDIEMTLTATSWTQEAEPFEFVTQQRDGWLTLAQARKRWDDAPADDPTLFIVLETAKTQCIEYAPTLPTVPEGEFPPIPLNYVQAQRDQARNIWNSAKTDPSTAGDPDLFVIRPFPMDNFIKNQLRPKRAVKVVG